MENEHSNLRVHYLELQDKSWNEVELITTSYVPKKEEFIELQSEQEYINYKVIAVKYAIFRNDEDEVQDDVDVYIEEYLENLQPKTKRKAKTKNEDGKAN